MKRGGRKEGRSIEYRIRGRGGLCYATPEEDTRNILLVLHRICFLTVEEEIRNGSCI